jgi:hypothetical protein
MKYIKLFEHINIPSAEILAGYGIDNFTINADGSVDVDGDVDFSDWSFDKIPIKFRKVSGDFYCYMNLLYTLKNCPEEVGGNFRCDSNRLKSLEFGPKYVGGNYYCSTNYLKNLEGSPEEVGGKFFCSNNNLNTLEGMPLEIGGDFVCRHNQYLKQLDSISNIEGDIICDEYIDISKFTGYSKNIIKR